MKRILSAVSGSAPFALAELTVIDTLENPPTVPDKLKDDAPLLSSPFVTMYVNVTMLPVDNALPKTPSPNITSY